MSIPRPNGGIRKLGTPTYMDRLLQQAISQGLTEMYDPEFSENSYGFRAAKNAHQALDKAKGYIKELEKRGHRFVRYSDDCSIYVKSKRAGERVMARISTYIEKELKLKVNMEKRSVTRPWHSKLLGFIFYHKTGEKGISVHRKSLATYKEKTEAITCRGRPYAMEDRMMQVRRLNHGWENYFKLSDAKSVFEELDSWVRSRIRLCYWKQWKKAKTRIQQLGKPGTKPNQAYQWGNTRKGYCRTVHSPILTRALNNTFWKKPGS